MAQDDVQATALGKVHEARGTQQGSQGAVRINGAQEGTAAFAEGTAPRPETQNRPLPNVKERADELGWDVATADGVGGKSEKGGNGVFLF